jgi:hypothetical protein
MSAQTLSLAILAMLLNGALCWSITRRHYREHLRAEDTERQEHEATLAALEQRLGTANATYRQAQDNVERYRTARDPEQFQLWHSIRCAASEEVREVAPALNAEQAA